MSDGKGLVGPKECYVCLFSSGDSKKGSLSLKVRERSEDSKRRSELRVKNGHRKPGRLSVEVTVN